MELHTVLFGITTVSMFISGFSFRKKSIIGIIISSLSAQIPFLVDMTTIGTTEIGKGIINAPAYEWIVAVLYIAFIWLMGFIVGGINLKKKDQLDDFPGKTVEYIITPFDHDK